MSLVIAGVRVDTPGFRSMCWLEDPTLRLSLPEDGRMRPGAVQAEDGTWSGWDLRAVVLHSTKGWPDGKHPGGGLVRPGTGPHGGGDRTFRFWREHGEQAGAHVTVDADGVVCQGADLAIEMAYHAGPVNPFTIGVEVYQDGCGDFYEGQLDAAADLVLWLCQRFGLPLRVQWPYPRHGGHPRPGILAARGVYGHRDVTDNRGWGDPCDAPILRLRDRHGFELADLTCYESEEVPVEAPPVVQATVPAPPPVEAPVDEAPAPAEDPA